MKQATLTQYRVHLQEWDEEAKDYYAETVVFDCDAEDEEHAKEQALDAYGRARILRVFDMSSKYANVTTKDIVIQMLTTNTGRHILDSGDVYGRNWERNQGRDFASEPKITSEARVYGWEDGKPGTLELTGTVSLYHWMMHNLEFDANLQIELDYMIEHEWPNDSGLEVAIKFAEQMQELLNPDAYGFFEPRTVNTYNMECDLSQTIQFVAANLDPCGYRGEESHLILQVHGGCDVRGGYTMPVVFRIRTESYEYESAMLAREYTISTDDGLMIWGDNTRPSDCGCCPPAIPDALDHDISIFNTMPAYKAEDLLAGDSACQIANDSDKVIQNLKGTTLTDEQRAAAEQTIRDNVNIVLDEALGAIIEKLRDEHEFFIVVRDRKAYLCGHDKNFNFPKLEDNPEIECSNSYM